MNKTSKKYYYYCTTKTLKSILDNHSLRLNDVRQSNDSDEVQYLYLKYKTELEKALNKSKNNIEKDFYKRVMDELDANYNSLDNSSSFYVISLSKNKDKLSQWRGYGDLGKGVSIGINIGAIKDFDYDELKMGRINYGINKINIKSEIKKAYKSCLNSIENFSRTKEPFRYDIDRMLWASSNEFAKKIIDNSILYKNKFFEEEDEFRLYNFSLKGECKPIRIKDFDGKIIKLPSPNLQFYSKDKKFKLTKFNYDIFSKKNYKELVFNKNINFIKEIILGSRCDIQVEDMKKYLSKHHYRNINVTRSKGTYR